MQQGAGGGTRTRRQLEPALGVLVELPQVVEGHNVHAHAAKHKQLVVLSEARGMAIAGWR